MTTLRIKRARGRPRALGKAAEQNRIRSLDRAMHLLKIVAAGGGMSLTEVAEASGQAPSTAYRVLITLQKHGMVEFEEPAQIWHVGVETFRIGSTYLGRTRIVEQSRPVMQSLMTETGETANLAIVDRGEVVFVSQVETHEPIRAFFRPGTRGPIHATGIGKALMAHFSTKEIEAILDGAALEAFTPKTIVGRDALVRELAATRARGFAIDDEEHTPGMRCIAAPIFNQFGEAVAGISLSGPSVRVTRARDSQFSAAVKSAADEITRSIGGTRPNPPPSRSRARKARP